MAELARRDWVPEALEARIHDLAVRTRGESSEEVARRLDELTARNRCSAISVRNDGTPVPSRTASSSRLIMSSTRVKPRLQRRADAHSPQACSELSRPRVRVS